MVTIKGVSDYGGFFILDPSFSDFDSMYDSIEGKGNDETLCERTPAGVMLLTSDKVNSIEINFEVLLEKPSINKFEEWSKVVESSLELTSDTLVFCTLPDGVEYPFGTIFINPASYVLRIYYRDELYGQKDEDIDNEDTEDRVEQFRIQAWCGSLVETTVLYSK
ncbi:MULTISPECIES: hypothetical protein [Pseudanabaena]|uniref:Uncharacterized protein n=2 Tax=Pseudanabaena TaxID=1152 RepID=L8MY22_9CYAN|nr:MULTISPECIES: hypothetical protein [Pseudanabaena]ELS32371.1 hypothetical protein Pse7429DRAFT_2522 [Pseudanabaena biceps PCC 7429]MDG3495403.1 hypothetical protein [Pseudanabaena catenata USMAC16]